MFKSKIPINEKIPECELERKPINLIDKESEVFIEFNSFVDELIERI